MKKIILSIVLILSFFSFVHNVKADSINKISMDIYVDPNGNAHITEKWDVNINNGTEGYKPYYNLGNSHITNFEVYGTNGLKYSYQNFWDVNDSFNDKAYKNGINYISNGLELCWGISNYGHNEYTLKYTITGFVAETYDKQMIYWTLIPYELSSKPKQVNIVIRADEYFSDDIAVWGYGNYGGTAYVYNGQIEMNSDGILDSSEYMTILVELPKGMFATDNILEEDFNDYYEKAEEGATHYDDNSSWNSNSISTIISIIFSMIFPVAFLILIFKGVTSSIKNKNFKKIISNGKFSKDINYFRDIPCNKEIFKAYFIGTSYSLNKKNTDFLGTLILSWIKKGCITIEKREKTGFLKKGEETALILHTDKFKAENEYENQMFDWMLEASGDGVLESKEFDKYCSKHYSKVLNWFELILSSEKRKCVYEGLITTEKKTFGTKYFETNAIYEEGTKLAGLKKFLHEFSSIEDKQAIEVHLWDYYLMYAQIFGIAEKVASEFKKLYPDVITDLSYDNVVIIRTFSYNSIHSATSAQSRAQSYSSGGGGFSSGGGGGGSFGGGGGGGGFR